MSHSDNPASDIAAVKRRFLQLFAANDLAGIARCYTEDAQMLPANMEPIAGRSAIQSVFKLTAVAGHTLQFQTRELEVHGATAVELGTYTRNRSDGSTFDRGKYMLVWKRVADAWLMHRDMFSTSMPRTAVAAATAS
jgi:ketosteroid isomerase-like protein